MQKGEFIEELCECLEVENRDAIDEETLLQEIPEYDSMARLALIALVDQNFGRTLSPSEFGRITTIKSLIQLIGEDNFE